MPKRLFTHRVVLAALLVGLAVAAAVAGAYRVYWMQKTCRVESVRDASVLLLRQRDRYDHSYQFATSAARSDVVRPVAELQQIRMDTRDIDVPPCLVKARQELLSYMDAVIQAFLAYGAQAPAPAVRDLLERSNTHHHNFVFELAEVGGCAPFCLPK